MSKAYLGTKISNNGIFYRIQKKFIINLYCVTANNLRRFQLKKTVKLTIQVLHDMALLDNYDNEDEVLKNYLLIEVNERRRPDIDPNK